MRVLYLANASQIGGGNCSLLALWEGLGALGVEMAAVCPEPGPMVEAAEAAGVPCAVIPLDQPSLRHPLATWHNRRQWDRLLDRLRPDLIHANGFAGARSITPAARARNLPLVCHVRFPPSEAYLQWAFRRLPPPDALIFNSEALKAEAGGFCTRACPQTRQVMIHNAVPLERFVPRPPHTGPGRRVGIIANFSPIKGHRDFLTMAGLLEARGPGGEYRLIGDDVHGLGNRAEMEAYAGTLGLNGAARFLGHVADIPGALQELDVLVCPSHIETFGRCVVEAMACQVPVVGTRVGGIPEVIEEGVTGLVVEKEAPEQLAQAVATLSADPALRQRMGEAGRQRAQRLFSIPMHAQRTLDLYRELLK